MRFTGQFAGVWICVGLSVAFGQQPVPATPGQDPSQTQDRKPLTPLEQRDKEIRVFDPLDKSNPILDNASNQNEDPSRAIRGLSPGLEGPRIPDQPSSQAKPLPGSVAASNQAPLSNPRKQGPQVTSDDPDATPVQEYSGPAVLSRSYTVSRPLTPQQVKWAPTLGFSVLRDTGLTGGKVNPDGSLANVASNGTAANWAFRGRHFWRHDQIGADYTGNYNNYGSNSPYNGFNQKLNLDFSHQFSRRISLNLVTLASSYSQSYSLQTPEVDPGTSIANMNLAASPSVQILDQGTRQFSNLVDLTWQKSARMSFNLGGGFFAVERTGAGVLGNTGYQARADANYRYTRKMTVGLYFAFTDYTFSQHIQINNSDTFGGIFSYALTRSAQIRLRGGVTRSESEGLTTVAIDPAIAILIGRGATIIDAYHLALLSDISAEIVKDFGRNRTANISYARGLAPGNGMILASTQEVIAAGFSARLFHTYRAGFSGGHSSLSSVSQTVGKYDSQYVSFTLSRSFRHNMTSNFEVDYRTFTLSVHPTVQNQLRISTGISWAPEEGKLW